MTDRHAAEMQEKNTYKQRALVAEALLRQAAEALDFLMDYIGQLERQVFPPYVDEAWEVTEATHVLRDINTYVNPS